MYNDVKSKVRSGAKLSDSIRCSSGVKQGDVCSPILFSLFINELALEIIEYGRHGVTFDLLELFILLFADDIVLLSTTVVGLQRQLNTLHSAATRYELRVNMSKTKVIVFRKGGYLARSEKWIYGGETMSVVNAYKYLGLYFTTKISFSYACEDIASRAKKAVFAIFHILYRLDCSSFQIFTKLFDAQVQPILQYGAEIWALDKGEMIEKVHLYALKRFLNVDSKTPNDLIYGELGRYPIYLNSYIKCIKYWLHLTRMDNKRIPFKCYKTLFEIDRCGKITWATNVRKFLQSHGFAYVWDNQGVENILVFLKCLKQRIIDCRWQDWHNHLCESDRFAQYKLFKTDHTLEYYVKINMNRYVKVALTKFRLGVSLLACHRLRYRHVYDHELRCCLCNLAKQDEVHVLFCCPILDDLRKKFIKPKYYSNPCFFRMVLLLTAKYEKTQTDLALFIYEAHKRISNALS